MQTITLDIHGMTYCGCVGNVYHALKNIDGVSDIGVSLCHHQAILNISPDLVTPNQLEMAISNLGYKPSLKSPSSNFVAT